MKSNDFIGFFIKWNNSIFPATTYQCYNIPKDNKTR